MKFDAVADYQETIVSKAGIRPMLTDVVLDLGCGRGDNAVIFARTARRVYAIDVEPWKDWKELSSKRLIFRRANGEKLPFRDKSFDMLFTKDTLHHVGDVDKTLGEMKRVTKKNGLIYIVESNRYNPIFYIHMTKMLGHEHFSATRFRTMIRNRFLNVQFLRVESRVYPVASSLLTGWLHTVESIVEAVPFINWFVTYNVAVIKNI